MLLRLSPRILSSRELIIRPFAGRDHVAEAGGLRVGWILHASAAEQPFWWWSITGPCCALARVPKAGRSATLEQAKADLSAAYARWLGWALDQGGDVTWFSREPESG